MLDKKIFFNEGHGQTYQAFNLAIAQGKIDNWDSCSVSITHFGDVTHYTDALQACSDFPQMKRLTVMCQDFPEFQEIPGAMRALTNTIKSNPQLEALELQYLGLQNSDEAHELFQAIYEHPNLCDLELYQTFQSADMQISCLDMIKQKKELRALTLLDEKFQCQGLVPLMKTNSSLEQVTMTFQGDDFCHQFCDAMNTNSGSKLASITLRRGLSHLPCTIHGDLILSMVNTLQSNNTKTPFSLSTDFIDVYFADHHQADQLLGMMKANVLAVIKLNNADSVFIKRIGDEKIFGVDGNTPNEMIFNYNYMFNAFKSRNVSIQRAWFSEARKFYASQHRMPEELDLLLPQFVYLHHQDKLKKIFGAQAVPEAYPVKLRAKSFFTLFKESPDALKAIDVQNEDLEQANEEVLQHEKEYGLEYTKPFRFGAK